MSWINILVTLILATGLFFFLGGAIGILRFPDFYSRLHPAGKLDTMGLFMTMAAMSLYTIVPLDPGGDSHRPENHAHRRSRLHHQPHRHPRHRGRRGAGRSESVAAGGKGDRT